MHLDGNLNAVILGELSLLGPIRDNFLFPLPIQDIQIFGRPGQVTQFGYLALSLSPGQPEKSITTGTSSFSASRIVSLLVSAYAFATALFGCRGLPWQLSALMVKPLSSSFCLNSFKAARSCSMDSLQCGSVG